MSSANGRQSRRKAGPTAEDNQESVAAEQVSSPAEDEGAAAGVPAVIEPVVFSFGGMELRAASGELSPLFVVSDVCAALEHTNVTQATARLDDDEKGVTTIKTLGGPQQVNVVTESGLYALILTSRKPQARAFRRWITSEVIPAIRKTGGYRRPNITYGLKDPDLSVPGRYVSILDRRTWRHYWSPYATVMNDVDSDDARTLAHGIKVIESLWHKVVTMYGGRDEFQDSHPWDALGLAIRFAVDSADQLIAVHEGRRHQPPLKQ